MSTLKWAAAAFVKLSMQLPFLPPTQSKQLYEFLMAAPESVKREAAKTLLNEEQNK